MAEVGESAATTRLDGLASSERRWSVGLFIATTLSVFLTYGGFWGGEGLDDGEAVRGAAAFAFTLMGILLAHELGHYVVARRHGFALSLPRFIPFPAAFGTFGAIIELRSEPRDRDGLLEMGAAGPLAGALCSFLALALGLPFTRPPEALQLTPPEPALWEPWLAPLLAASPRLQAFSDWLSPPVPDGELPVLIFANPLVMDLLGELILGAAPDRLAVLSPVAMAGWVGCLLTGINLVPIGQLDGGHILNALWPVGERRRSSLLLGVALLGGIMWSGWLFWGLLLALTGAWRGISPPLTPPLSGRAKAVAAVTALVFFLTFMPRPVEMDSLPAPPPAESR
ncbi:site-2 protease family protein [Myxococcota bacterium]|nr:site-2 protease family protein [Myxococcota bacterium]